MNFKKIKIVTPNEIIESSLEIKDGLISTIGQTSNIDGLDLGNYYLVPGFIDQHIHGAANYDFMDVNIFDKAKRHYTHHSCRHCQRYFCTNSI